MYRRTWTLVAACLLALTLGVLGATLPVPMVALSPGPTYNTLGEVDGAPVVDVEGLPVYPTSGHLNMTTVSVTDRLTMFSVVGRWASADSQVVPRAQVFRPDRTKEEIRKQNEELFASSEANAESATLAELGIPATVIVTSALPESPATSVLQPGDELISVAGRPIDAVHEVTDVLAGTRPGDVIRISYGREGTTRHDDVVLGSWPDRQHGFLGIVPAGKVREGDIRFELGGIGGPSAGLMFALALVDKLTAGELTGGRFIAGTGSVGPAGAVSPISGVQFKMRQARDSGASAFLVPAENCEEAVTAGSGEMELIKVGSLHEAVGALEALRDGAPVPTC